ncbi:hypothetical protein [Segniliparus rugosus]|uniref:Uncharacterized protein n=1 Tax=Segniliparus rugosus (strain ATCC BAA-974 / DSM 45345 / CCUG 50838 / CIP 108380 / JCM 13579 / CDC 945) TaxID=679197 RepID=E5XRC6_SEGRC|nr:hypothetical protein [Segniliparus rugosus]EFV13096.1 hypothetical protein HMPREF9336_02048 [Segniliparus rugosus ATCC BAA-974]
MADGAAACQSSLDALRSIPHATMGAAPRSSDGGIVGMVNEYVELLDDVLEAEPRPFLSASSAIRKTTPHATMSTSIEKAAPAYFMPYSAPLGSF